MRQAGNLPIHDLRNQTQLPKCYWARHRLTGHVLVIFGAGGCAALMFILCSLTLSRAMCTSSCLGAFAGMLLFFGAKTAQLLRGAKHSGLRRFHSTRVHYSGYGEPLLIAGCNLQAR